MGAKEILLVVLVLIGIGFGVFWIVAARGRPWRPRVIDLIVGFVTDFFDTLGIGSFAVTTSIYKIGNLVDDAEIPGTLNVGHGIPTVAQALIYITIVKVEMTTLVSMIAASVLGAWLGAGVVARWPRRRIQMGMGVLLIVAAAIIVLRVSGSVPAGSDALGLRGPMLAVGVAGNFVLGAFMTLGIGLYAPCMILISLLGMNAATAFPIMMGSCAFLMPAASARFIREGRYNLPASVGLTLAGTPAVLIAAWLVKELPLNAVKWLVVVVVVYTAVTMLRSAAKEGRLARNG
jgi:uncharacterized membrane protein YfcA